MQSYLARNNIFAHPERLEEWIRRGITYPITAEIDPSNKCNHYCPKCSGNRTDPNAELSLDYMKGIIDETSPFLKDMVFTGGGEPLINKDTPKAISYAKEKGIEIGLITNGSLFDRYDTEKLLSDCSWIRVSIEGLYSKHYAMRTNTDEREYFRVWDNVKRLVETRKRKGSDCVIGIAYLTEEENTDQLMGFSLRSREAGADYAQFRPFHHSETNLLKEIEECKSLDSDEFSVIASEEKYRNEKFDYERAFADEFRFVISANGGVYPCCYTRGLEDFYIDNILLAGFERIWESKRREEVSENKLKTKSCPEMCYKDPLNQKLWEIHRMDPINQKLWEIHRIIKEVKKEGKHLNFI
ncbi:MAG: radical SAM protein [Candidatus Aenigmarchaeota archaeon]|nr:radical SAM protein [Candidatus Aenigmarchaeota archaeon]NIP40393.1 radical SAM protein [Candidatus Aenigmarchaeota archaeon]NIQ18319.1 radical SAM protein [Candidatus Aenigmarchaeota archaeon]NIS73271.1 radical SAM protein [Candidatus Aenigmarchaeota archaeon]